MNEETIKYVISVIAETVGFGRAKQEVGAYAQQIDQSAQKLKRIVDPRLGSGYRDPITGRAISRTQALPLIEVEKEKLYSAKLSDIQSQFKQGIITSSQYRKNLTELQQTFGKSVHDVDKLDQSQKNLLSSQTKLAMRAIAVIPIWMALRAAYMAIIKTVQDSIKYIIDFDKAMARVTAVTSGISNLTGFTKELREEIKKLAIETGKNVTEIAEAYYRFGTAGIKGSEAIAGMNAALKTSIAIMGDTTQTARVIADLYNLLSENMDKSLSPSEKMNEIGATMAILWKTNAFELNEMNTAISNFATVAGNLNLSLDQTLTLLAVLHTAAQRSGTAGTQLARAFMMLGDRLEKVESFLGRPIDRGNIQFFELMMEVITKMNQRLREFGEGAVAIDIAKLFGMRAARGVGAFVVQLGKLTSEYQKIISLPYAQRMAELEKMYTKQTDKIEVQIARMRELRNQISASFLEGITGATNYEEALKRINSLMEKMIPTAKALGIALPAALGALFGGPLGAVVGGVTTVTMAATEGMKQQADKIAKMSSDIFKATVTKEMSAKEIFGVMKDIMGGKYDEYFREYGVSKERLMDTLSKIVAEKVKEVELGKIVVDQSKEHLMTLDDISKRYEVGLAMLDRYKTLGYNEIEIEKMKLMFMIQQHRNDEEIYKQRVRVIELMNQEIIKLGDNLQTSFNDSIKSFLNNEIDITSMFKRIGDTARESLYESISGGLTSQIFKATGIGETFGLVGSNFRRMISGEGGITGGIKNSFDYGSNLTYDAIVKGFQVGTGQMTMGATTVGWTGGGGSLGQWTLPGFGQGGWFNQPLGGRQVTTIMGRPVYMGQTKGGATTTRGQIAGAGVMGALTGYSAYQSASAGGVSQGQSIASGILSGAGMMGMGMLAGGTALPFMAAAGPVGWAIAGALIVGGLLLGTLGKKSQQTQIETKTTESSITSRIDVTNKNLSIINRNLIALRSDIREYILPQSAYFSEKSGIEAEFSIMSRRGFLS